MKIQKRRIIAALALITTLAAIMPFIAYGSHGATIQSLCFKSAPPVAENCVEAFAVSAPSGRFSTITTISGYFTVPNPARDVTIELHSHDGQVLDSTTVSPADPHTPQNFRLYDLPPGTYSLVFRQPGHTSFTLTGIIVTDRFVDINQCKNFPETLPLWPGNVTESGQINASDLAAMLQNWTGSYINANPTASGQVNIADLILLISNWMAESTTQEFTGTSEPTINYVEQALQTAEDFLMRFPTIFMDTVPRTGGWVGQGQFYMGQDVFSYDTPAIFYNIDTGGYYDANGNRFPHYTPWLTRGSHAYSFKLFDLDNSGIPYILISSYTEYGRYAFLPHTLYRYINGEFRRVYGGSSPIITSGLEETSFFPHTSFFNKPDGSLVGFAWQNLMEYAHGTLRLFSAINFHGNWADVGVLAREITEFRPHYGDQTRFWRNYITGEYLHYWPTPPAGWDINPDIATYLPGSDTRLTPIAPLTGLQWEITSRVQYRLGVY